MTVSMQLSDRQFEALCAAQAGRLFRVVATGRYAVRRPGARERTVSVPARVLAASGLIRMVPVSGTAWEQAVPTAMGLLTLGREAQARQEAEAVPPYADAVKEIRR